MPSFGEQLRLLLWRNALMKRRATRDTAMEILFPVLFMILILSLKNMPNNSEKENDAIRNQPIHMPSAEPLSSYIGASNIIIYSPNVSHQVDAIINDIQRQVPFTRFIGFATPDDLDLYYRANDIPTTNVTMKAGIIFNTSSDGTLPSASLYTLRLNGSTLPSTSRYMNDDDHDVQYQSVDNEEDRLYLASGYIRLQLAINDAIIALRYNESYAYGTINDGWSIPSLTTQFQRLPVASWFSDPFHDTLVNIGSLYLVVGFYPIVSKLLTALVLEKERRTREGMKMMGLPSHVLNLAWYLTYVAITIIPISFIAVVCTAGGLFKYTSGLVVFVMIFLYVQTLILLSFLLSVFFSSSKSAGQFGGLFIMILFVPSYAIKDTTPPSLIGIASLLSPIAFSQAFKGLADAETAKNGLSFGGNMTGGDNTPFAFSSALLMFVVDIIVYAVFAWYGEQVVPSEYGTTRRPCFCFERSYWTRRQPTDYSALSSSDAAAITGDANATASSSSASIPLGDRSENNNNNTDWGVTEEVEKKVSQGGNLRIAGLRKVFDPKPCSSGANAGGLIAVDNLNLTMYEGQILSLLGHNGAGKSTTIGMLTGLIEATAGEVSVLGVDLTTQMEEVRRLLGVCPQHDILFDTLTVREHLRFYAILKGVAAADIDSAILEKATEVDLVDKLEAASVTLSGGQKRRLSVAIALIGNSRVIFLDEPTSGMDPSARRLVWALLQRYKRGRIIVLTTHFMDEADLLGDRIAIISKGRLRCVGSSLFLKARFGIGYHLDMVPTAKCQRDAVTSLVTSLVPSSKLLSTAASELSYVMPLDQIGRFASLFESLEAKATNLGVLSYGISLTTLEEVFLNLAAQEEIKPPQADDNNNNGSGSGSGNCGQSEGKSTYGSLNGSRKEERTKLLPVHDHHFGDVEAGRLRLRPSCSRQLKAMLIKRLINSKRSLRGLFFQFGFPLIYVLLAVAVFTNGIGEPAAGRTSPPSLSMSPSGSLAQYVAVPVALGGANAILQNATADRVVPLLRRESISTSWLPTGYNESIDYLLSSSHPTTYAAIYGYDIAGTRVMYNRSTLHAIPVWLDMMASSIMWSFNHNGTIADGTYSLQSINHPFSYVEDTSSYFPGGIGNYLLSLFVGIAFSYIPVTFAVTIVKEKEVRAKHQQLVMGVRPATYWLANFIFDFACFLIPVCATFIIMAIFGKQNMLGDRFPAALAVFIVYVAASTMMTYALSFAFAKSTTAQSTLIAVYGFVSLLLYLVSQFISSDIGKIINPIFHIMPQFGLMYGINKLGVAMVDAQACVAPCQPLTTGDLFAWKYVGMPLLLGVLHFCVTSLIVLLLETGTCLTWRCCSRTPGLTAQQVAAAAATVDESDVAAETKRVLDRLTAAERDTINIEQLRKVYPAPDGAGAKVAVHSQTLGIPDGECFGLLGPNGAGKTTTLSMITGDVSVTSGDAHLAGASIVSNIYDAFTVLGFCPQFDALFELMTGREHLMMYAMIKGVRDEEIPSMVSYYMDQLQLTAHADKLSSKYSGGNKRKLSLAIALMGHPKIVLLDEPSTGMDPFARRGMWNVISSEMKGRSAILTTHSMEESEALCTRIGIMVNGRLRCIGSSQHLKSKYGSGLEMEIKTRDDEKCVTRVKQFVTELIPSVKLQEDFGGKLRYSLPRMASLHTRGGGDGQSDTKTSGSNGADNNNDNDEHGGATVTLSRLFGEIERVRHTYEIADYAISQTTMEQVFLGFAKKQDITP